MSAVLGYEPVRDGEAPGAYGSTSRAAHRLSPACKDELLAALHDLRPRKGARLVLFGADVATLGEAERAALVRRVGFVPANGGLMSSLNAWENISLCRSPTTRRASCRRRCARCARCSTSSAASATSCSPSCPST